MHSSVGRSDDIRQLRMCHLLTFVMDCIGPCPFWVLAAVLTKGKTQEVLLQIIRCSLSLDTLSCLVCPWPSNCCAAALTPQAGAKGYKGVSRNLDPVVCPFRAMAFYFWGRFVARAEPFPDPMVKAEW